MPHSPRQKLNRKSHQTSPVSRYPYRVCGEGHWGRSIGKILRTNGFSVEFLEVHHTLEDWNRILKDPCYVVLATPFRAIESCLQRIKSASGPRGIINASKGVDRNSLMTFTPLAKSILTTSAKKTPFATLSGPTFAQEVWEEKPAACVLAGSNSRFVKSQIAAFSTPYFRVYAHRDPIGVEVCAALKNVLAIAAGFAEGLKLGNNARAALLTRGMMEMMVLLKAMGGKASTVIGLAGVGDLWLTAAGDLSRNRQFGEKLGRGLSVEQALQEIGQTVEGYYTLTQVEALRKKRKLKLPICEEVYNVVFKKKAPLDSIRSLMTRDLKEEESSQFLVHRLR